MTRLRTGALTAALLCALTVPCAVGAQARHPLDPLTYQEHWTVLEVLRAANHYSNETGVAVIALHEPGKDSVWSWQPGQPFARRAEAILTEEGRTYEAVIDVANRRLLSYTHVPGAQVHWLAYEYEAVDADVKTHPEFIAAMRRRGITDLTFIDCGSGPPGYFGTPEQRGRRIAYVGCYDARQVRNTWTRTIEGLTVVYDMNAGDVLRVIDEGAVPVPTTNADYDVGTIGPLRDPLPPITITQPQGPGFRLDGNVVEWMDWRFHVRPDLRTGMIVSTVTWQDGERRRPILYQGHISEIFVPYMDPAPSWYVRNYLDLGEYVAGGLARAMEPGIDCPQHATWMSQVVSMDNGRPMDVPRVICIFERVTGNAVWRRVDDGRPERELVARMTAVVGNYDYIIDWVFRPDGSIRVGVGATGITEVKMTAQRNAQSASSNATSAVAGARADSTGRFVADNVVAINHDHYYNFRLDMDVDGRTNRVQADRLVAQQLPDSIPRRSMWVLQETLLRREHDARLSMDMHRPSLWRVTSPTQKNHVGYATSYQLVPGHNVHTLLSADDYPRRRAGFIDHQLWVTPYSRTERFAAGMYPTLSEPGAGLPAWTAGNRSIENTDVVLWYTMGMHHVPRAEDWPVMPVQWSTFELRPFDFFNGNPALRLPYVP